MKTKKLIKKLVALEGAARVDESRSTWAGGPGVLICVYAQKSDTGLRVTLRKTLGTEGWEVKVIRGDGRYDGFLCLYKQQHKKSELVDVVRELLGYVEALKLRPKPEDAVGRLFEWYKTNPSEDLKSFLWKYYKYDVIEALATEELLKEAK